jgi:hypothetical protein
VSPRYVAGRILIMDVRTLANLAVSTTDKDKATWAAVKAIMTPEQAQEVADVVATILAEEAQATVRKSLTGGATEAPDDVVGEAYALMTRAAAILAEHAPRNPRNSSTWDGYVMRCATEHGGVKVTLTV